MLLHSNYHHKYSIVNHIVKKTLFIGLVILLFTSCYHDYLIVNSEFSKGITVNDTNIVFFHFLRAGQPPKGISRFPDGGTHKTIYKNTSVYCYDKEKKEIQKLFDFKSFPSKSGWSYEISSENNLVLFSICPIMGWKYNLKDSTHTYYKDYHAQYAGFYIYYPKDEIIRHLRNDGYNPLLSPDGKQIVYLMRDSVGVEIWLNLIAENKNRILKKVKSNTAYIRCYWEDNKHIVFAENKEPKLLNIENNEISTYDKPLVRKQNENEIPIRKVKELMSGVTFKDWGFDIQKYWLKSDKEYINDIIALNGNLSYRKAILEEIGNKLSKEDITKIIQRMDNYKDKLESYKKTEYEMLSKETIALLDSLLKYKK